MFKKSLDHIQVGQVHSFEPGHTEDGLLLPFRKMMDGCTENKLQEGSPSIIIPSISQMKWKHSATINQCFFLCGNQ